MVISIDLDSRLYQPHSRLYQPSLVDLSSLQDKPSLYAYPMYRSID